MDIEQPQNGMRALVVRAWGDVYGVAAHWEQASCPVLCYGEMGWRATGKQVADYRHSARAALAEILAETATLGGDEVNMDVVQDIVDHALWLVEGAADEG